jgi:hypothetical protein
MDLQQRIASHLAGVIAATPVDSAPFDHLVIENVFPPDVYARLRELLPADTYYRELKHSDAMLPDGRSARLQFPLLPENSARLAEPARSFWNAVAAALHSAQVEAAYRVKFRATLERVTGKSMDRIRLRPYTTLFRDLGGYRISIHPDSPRKAITTQYYLPADDSQLHLGTVFHTKRADGTFEIARSMRFAPNSGYAFAVTLDSFHSVNPMRPDDRPRDSLMVIINHDRGPLVEGFKSAQKKLRALYDRLAHPGPDPADAGEGRYDTM